MSIARELLLLVLINLTNGVVINYLNSTATGTWLSFSCTCVIDQAWDLVAGTVTLVRMYNC